MTMSLFHICEIVQIVFGSFQKNLRHENQESNPFL